MVQKGQLSPSEASPASAGPTGPLLAHPASAYTQMLIDSHLDFDSDILVAPLPDGAGS